MAIVLKYITESYIVTFYVRLLGLSMWRWMIKSKHIHCTKILLLRALHTELKGGLWNFKESARDLLPFMLKRYLIMTLQEVTLSHIWLKTLTLCDYTYIYIYVCFMIDDYVLIANSKCVWPYPLFSDQFSWGEAKYNEFFSSYAENLLW